MKKVLSIALVACAFAIYSCGPSAEEKAAAEKAKADSIQKVMDDSMAMANKAAADKAAADMAAANEQHMKDSVAAAEASKAKPAAKPAHKGKK